MFFLELTKKRYSVRSYTSQEVEKEKLDYILECARYAPSAVNKQPWQFIVIQSELQKKSCKRFTLPNGLWKPPYISLYVLMIRLHGHVSMIIKIMQILMLLSLRNISVWQQRNKG